MFYSLFTWRHPASTKSLFFSLLAVTLASCFLNTSTMFFMAGQSCMDLSASSVFSLAGRSYTTLYAWSLLFLAGQSYTTLYVWSLFCLSSHLFLCLPCRLSPFTVPYKMVMARPNEQEKCPYRRILCFFTMARSSCGPIAYWILARTSSLVTWSLYEMRSRKIRLPYKLPIY